MSEPARTMFGSSETILQKTGSSDPQALFWHTQVVCVSGIVHYNIPKCTAAVLLPATHLRVEIWPHVAILGHVQVCLEHQTKYCVYLTISVLLLVLTAVKVCMYTLLYCTLEGEAVTLSLPCCSRISCYCNSFGCARHCRFGGWGA